MKRKLLYKLFPICLALLLAVGSPVYAQPVGADPPSQDIFIQTEEVGDPIPEISEIPEVSEIAESPVVPESPEITDTLENESKEAPAATPSDDLSSDVTEVILDAADMDKLQRMLAAEGYVGIAPMSVEYISNFAQLENALNDPAVTVAVIMGDIEMERTLTIDRDLIFLAVADAVLWAPPTDYSRHFSVINTADTPITIDFNRIILDGRGTGGGLECMRNSLVLKGAVMQNCKADTGGAIFTNPADLRLENCTITGNTAGSSGGGIYSSGGTLTLDNSVITNNYSGEHGGGVTTRLLTMADTEITGNTAGENGGGIYYRGNYYSETDITMGNSTIENNEASYGGGIYIEAPDACTVELLRGTIKNNSAEYGGGIYGQSAPHATLHLVLQNMTLTENQASVSGGGISFDYGNLNMDDTIISQNYAAENGGGICMPNGYLHLTYVDISSNIAGANGGAIYTSVDNSYHFQISKSNISENQAQNGGGIAVCANSPENAADYDFIISSSTIEGNTAFENGGGVYYEGASHFWLESTTVINNTSTSGGGIWLVRLADLSTNSEVIFAGNKADEGYIMTDPADIATHELLIKATQFSEPFTLYAYNNYDISYTKGELLVPLTINYYIRSTDTTPYATSYVYANKALETGDLPDDPSQYGLIFLGWTDENNIFYYPDTIITEDTDLYACWRLL